MNRNDSGDENQEINILNKIHFSILELKRIQKIFMENQVDDDLIKKIKKYVGNFTLLIDKILENLSQYEVSSLSESDSELSDSVSESSSDGSDEELDVHKSDLNFDSNSDNIFHEYFDKKHNPNKFNRENLNKSLFARDNNEKGITKEINNKFEEHMKISLENIKKIESVGGLVRINRVNETFIDRDN
jgi:hypothetical protein